MPRQCGGTPRRCCVQSLDMGLIDDGVFPRDRKPAFLAPGEGGIDDDGLRHAARIVASIEGEVGARTAGAIPENARQYHTRTPA